jgi:Glycosyltransferase Family 4
MATDTIKSTADTKRLRVLITNMWLDSRGGTESVVRDLAAGLLARGHRPIVYSPLLGKVAEEIRQRGVPTIDDLGKIGEAPDVIHGHHFIPTGEAIIRFPATPTFFVSHSWQYWIETPPKFPQIRQYAAVDEGCRDRLVDIEGIPADRVMMLFNAVDLTRVPLRSRALETRPLRALAFTKFKSHLPILRAACERTGLEYAELGQGIDRVVSHPEEELARYDVVFASARCALEAACAGSAVICCDERGLGGLVTSADYDRFRRNNFGLRAIMRALTVETVLGEIRKYNRDDVIAVSARAREDADLAKWLDAVEKIYFRIIDDNIGAPIEAGAHHQALLQFLDKALPRTPSFAPWPWLTDDPAIKLRDLDHQCAAARHEAAAARSEAAAVRHEVDRLRRSRMLRWTQAIRRMLGLPYVPGL